jgi:hypothetical protein
VTPRLHILHALLLPLEGGVEVSRQRQPRLRLGGDELYEACRTVAWPWCLLRASFVVEGHTSPRFAISAKRLDAAKRAQERVQRDMRVLNAALYRAQKELVAVVQDLAEDIVTEHLRPVYSRVLAEAEEAAPRLAGATDAASALARGPQSTEAYRELEKSHAIYRTVRVAWRLLFDQSFRDETVDDSAW